MPRCEALIVMYPNAHNPTKPLVRQCTELVPHAVEYCSVHEPKRHLYDMLRAVLRPDWEQIQAAILVARNGELPELPDGPLQRSRRKRNYAQRGLPRALDDGDAPLPTLPDLTPEEHELRRREAVRRRKRLLAATPEPVAAEEIARARQRQEPKRKPEPKPYVKRRSKAAKQDADAPKPPPVAAKPKPAPAVTPPPAEEPAQSTAEPRKSPLPTPEEARERLRGLLRR